MGPLHPLAVHFPIVLTVAWPVVDAVGLWSGRRDISKVAIAMLGVAVLSSFVATVTGQSAFDAAFAAGVSAEILNSHADDAGLVPWMLLLLLVARVVGELKFGKRGQTLAIVLGVLAWVLVYNVGESGGALVFEYGVGVEREARAR